MLDHQLSQIGLTEKETRVYIELLKWGPQPVSVIAKKAKLNRSSSYELLTSLEKKGILSSFKKNKVKCFAANDPNCLISYLDSRTRNLEYQRMEILSSIPKFRELSSTFDFKKPVVSIFEGIEGVKHVLYDTSKTHDKILTYLCTDKFLKWGNKSFLEDYKDYRFINRNNDLRGISIICPEVKKFFGTCFSINEENSTEILYINPQKNEDFFENEISIYDNKIAIMHPEQGNEYGIIIESQEIASTNKIIFEMVWNGINR
jgi:sugar-specific transcriptional regulator TrmB